MQKLIFIYNAKSGMFNQSVDFLHKVFSPKTYACDLCSITHGNFGSKKDWANFISEIKVNTEFKYCNQRSAAEKKFNCPVVLLENSENIEQLVASSELKDLNLHDLIAIIDARIN